ncbi:MAG TPA: sugar ABC transporter ATP-binding protein [Bauldia sp.]|nr:sugar ABC transporter ATP-binding protein [Bauldia sp.]
MTDAATPNPGAGHGTTPRLDVTACSKSFPGVQALNAVSLSVMPGEIHALLGENGAGKSTLGKIIGGVYRPDAAEIRMDGRPVHDLDEATAGELGIAIVHQEGSLVPQLSIAENIFAGRQPTGAFGMVDRREMHRRASSLMADLGTELDPATAVRHLSTAQAQVVEIAKVLSRELKLLILDEPTAALTQAETARLFGLVRRLRQTGVAVIYISHRLAEIFELCDNVTVLKDGRVTGTRLVKDTTEDELIRLMVGRDVLFARGPAAVPGDTLLEVEHLSAPPFVHDATFRVRAGEIVCLAGLIGSGRSETCEAIFGVRPTTSGVIRHKGRPVSYRDPSEAIHAGIGMMPEDRKEAGLFLGRSVADNISVAVLDKVTRYGVVSDEACTDLANRFIRELKIATPSPRQILGNLSGGNQQKALLAKWLAPDPDVLIVDEPTRGVDVGARAEIYRILGELKARRLAILVVSSDLPEVLTLADRIVVMAGGRTVGELNGERATEEEILRLATRQTATAWEEA